VGSAFVNLKYTIEQINNKRLINDKVIIGNFLLIFLVKRTSK